MSTTRRPVPARPVPARAGRRDDILRAAARLFAERGYAGASIDDIGEAVGVSGPAIYWHFDSKEELLAEMLTGISDLLQEGGVERVAAEVDPHRALTALVRFHVSFAVGQPDLITVHHRELSRVPEAARRHVRRTQRRYVEQWVTVLGRLHPRADEAVLRAAIQATFGLINSTPHLAPGRSAGEHAELLTDMALAALAAGARSDQRR
jgi:AcrR family transcriptional regulator